MHEIPIPFLAGIQNVILEKANGDPADESPEVGFTAKEVEAIRQELVQAHEQQIRELQQDLDCLKPTLARMGDTCGQLAQQQQQRIGEMRDLAIELSVAIASQILHVSLEAGNFGVEQLVKQVVDHLGDAGTVEIFLHPEDLKLLHFRLGDELDAFVRQQGVSLQTDSTLSRGDCRGEAGDCKALSHVRTQLESMRDGLLGTLAGCDSDHVES